jgi:signal transduction histidine kinase
VSDIQALPQSRGAQIEAGALTLNASAVYLPKLVADCMVMFRASAEARGLALSLAIAPEAERTFSGDAVRLGQILSNLLSNALASTHSGGVEVVVEAQLDIDGAWLTLAVCDSGEGIDGATAAELELSICRALAEAMGGEITTRSCPGQGSTIILALELPYAEMPVDFGPGKGSPSHLRVA